MASDAAEPWRRTGRKAAAEHLVGVEKDTLMQVALYHNDGSRQGQGIIQLLNAGEECPDEKGKVHTAHFLAIEDGYYEWWLKDEFGTRPVPVHFCEVPASRCTAGTMYRNPIHVDVFRVLPGRSATKVTWLKDDSKKVVNEALDALKSSTSPDVTPGAPGVGSKGGGGPTLMPCSQAKPVLQGLLELSAKRRRLREKLERRELNKQRNSKRQNQVRVTRQRCWKMC